MTANTAKSNARFSSPSIQPDGDSFKVLGWQVFKPGYWKKQYFTADDCKRVVENFQKYSAGESAWVKAKAKLGHDDEQRLANSLGLPNQGQIVDCRQTPDGGFEIDIHGVPQATADEINAGRINDGSVELDWEVPDPTDPSKMIPGPVLTGVAFLGEEQPGVKGLPSPKATFSNHRRTKRHIRFSEVEPMNRDDLIAQLKAKGVDVSADPALANLPDEALAALLKAMPAATPAPAPAMSDGKDDADQFKAMMAKFADMEKKQEEMSAKFGHLNAAFADSCKDKDEVKAAAAFAKDYVAAQGEAKKARATEIVTKAVSEGRALPVAKEYLIDDLCRLPDDKKSCFADGVHKGKSPFAVACEELLKRPKDMRFNNEPNPLNVGSQKMDESRRKELLAHTGELGHSILRREKAAAK